jgi:hypothetical protein
MAEYVRIDWDAYIAGKRTALAMGYAEGLNSDT